MNKKEVVEYCLSLPKVFEDYPFKEDNITIAMKHNKNKKWFVLIMDVNNTIYVNVKTNPEYSELLRKSYKYIIPAYHMNKEHWNTIILDDNVDKKLVEELIQLSYSLTKK